MTGTFVFLIDNWATFDNKFRCTVSVENTCLTHAVVQLQHIGLSEAEISENAKRWGRHIQKWDLRNIISYLL